MDSQCGQNFKVDIKTPATISDRRRDNRCNYDVLLWFLFTIIINSAIWYGLSIIVNKYYWKTKGVEDQKYLLQYAISRISSR